MYLSIIIHRYLEETESHVPGLCSSAVAPKIQYSIVKYVQGRRNSIWADIGRAK